MKPRALVLSSALVLLPVLALPAAAQTRSDLRDERSEHPRITRAIDELQDAIDYLQKAPDTFGGHKAAAIDASQRAIQELRAAIAYKARQEDRGPDRNRDRDRDRDNR